MRRGWLWLGGGIAGFAVFVHSCVRFVPAGPDDGRPFPQDETYRGQLALPVAQTGRDQLVDTFTQGRKGGRPHDAIDIMAPRGTPVLAAAPGVVEKLFHSERGGNTIYVRSPDRKWVFYYAHLDSYRPGLAEGDSVRRGQMIGTVGSTGNANPDGPHLHFAINRMEAGQSWYEGRPINPYPLLAAD